MDTIFDMNNSLLKLVKDALTKLGLSTDFEFQKPPSQEYGDFCLPCFPYSKILKKSPQQIGELIKENIQSSTLIDKIDIKSGYLNISLNRDFFNKIVINQILKQKENYGSDIVSNKKKYVIEYSAPNSNKPLHLGHIRNNCIGLALSKIIKHIGHDVISANLINDRGIHIAKTLISYLLWANGDSPEKKGIKGDHFVGDLYVKFENEWRKEFDNWLKTEQAKAIIDQWTEKLPDLDKNLNNDALLKKFKASFEDDFFNLYSAYGLKAKECLKKWESGDKETYDLWLKLRNWVLKGFEDTYNRMGNKFDKIYYESETYKLGKQIIEEGLEKGIFEKLPDGAVVCSYDKLGLKGYNTPYKILKRNDGTSVYITQDVGTAIARYRELAFDRMIYVVGDEQIHHFKVLFAILGLIEPQLKDACYHLAYGMVNLPEGKMKTREGKVVEADQLMDEMKELSKNEILKQIDEQKAHRDNLSLDEISRRAELIAQGALKFYLLSFIPQSTVQFNPQKSIDFQGKTGPYCMYSYARTRSIINKAQFNYNMQSENVLKKLTSEKEKILINNLMLFSSVLKKIETLYSIEKLAEITYDIARSFNQIFNDREGHPILNCQDNELKLARLQLVEATGITIKIGLNLLGIEVLEEM